MPINVRLVGTQGDMHFADVGTQNNLKVEVREGDPPPLGAPNRYRYFNSRLGTTGADSGTVNMNVDGSITPTDFYIESSPLYDIRIMLIVIIIADSAVVHSSFGNVAALATGWTLKVIEAGVSTNLINAAKTGGQVIAQSGFGYAYGDAATSFELTNWTSTEDATTAVIRVGEIVPGGLRIGRGTRDRIVSEVRDNLTGLTEFYTRVIGYRHYL